MHLVRVLTGDGGRPAAANWPEQEEQEEKMGGSHADQTWAGCSCSFYILDL